MISIATHTMIIQRPLSVAYDYMIDHENYVNWYPDVANVTPIDNLPAGTPGKKYREIINLSKSRQTEFIVEVKEAVPNRRYALEADWNLQTRMEVSFEPLSDQDVQINSKFISRSDRFLVRALIFLFVRRLAKRNGQKGLEQLKALLDNEPQTL